MLQISVFEVCHALPNRLAFPSTCVSLSEAPLPWGTDIPDGAAEQDGVLEDDGQAGPEGLQRQLGDVDVVDHYPPCGKLEDGISQRKSHRSAD